MTSKETKQTAKKEYPVFFTLAEEIANGVTHGVGLVLSVAGLTTLLVLSILFGNNWQIVSFSIYGASLIILYGASTLYHSIQDPPTKHVLRIFDHASIYLLIAGTYTPFLLLSIRGTLGWTMLAIIWLIAVVGISLKLFFVNKYAVISTIAYIGMGWLAVFTWQEMMAAVPTIGVYWLIAGGILYTSGVLFFALQKMPYNHAVWHLFVLGGSFCHYMAVFQLVPAITV